MYVHVTSTSGGDEGALERGRGRSRAGRQSVGGLLDHCLTGRERLCASSRYRGGNAEQPPRTH